MGRRTICAAEENSEVGSCRVCGASGGRPHFGAIACNGCRNFFRRCTRNNKSYKCEGDGTCSVSSESCRACRGCRLARCKAAGMDAMLESEREWRGPASAVVSARLLLRQNADKMTDIAPSPLLLRFFPHAVIVQHLIEQERRVEQMGTSVTGSRGLDNGRLFRTDLMLKAVLAEPGIAAVRTPICWEARRLIQPSDIPFIITRGVVFCIDWANLLSDFLLQALAMPDREALFRARGSTVALLVNVVNSFVRGGGGVMLMLDGTFYPRNPHVQSQLPLAANHIGKMNMTTTFDDVFSAMLEIAIDDGEIAVLRALALFMSTPKLSNEARRHVEETKTRYVDALYAHIRQRRPELSERKVAMRVAKILLLLPLFKRLSYEGDQAIQALAVCNIIRGLRGLPYELHSPDASSYE